MRFRPASLCSLAFALAACGRVEETRHHAAPAVSSSATVTPPAPPKHVDYEPGASTCFNVARSIDQLGKDPFPVPVLVGSQRVLPSVKAIETCADGHGRTAGTEVASNVMVDVFEVTHACYRECVVAGKCAKPETDPDDPVQLDWDDYRRANQPIGHITYAEMSAYCAFRGGRVATYSELTLAMAHPASLLGPESIVAAVTACHLGTGGPLCPWFDAMRTGSPSFEVRRGFDLPFPWHPADAPDMDAPIVMGETALGQDLMGSVGERTASTWTLSDTCAGTVDDHPAEGASETLLFDPLEDLHRALQSDGVYEPRTLSVAARSYKVGFRCAE